MYTIYYIDNCLFSPKTFDTFKEAIDHLLIYAWPERVNILLSDKTTIVGEYQSGSWKQYYC